MRNVLTILLLFWSLWIQGQFTKSYLLGEYEEIVVPFTYANGFILVDVIFQRLLPLKFIVDTGAENSILLKKEYTDLLKTPYHKKIKLYGSDLSDEVTAYVCNGTYLQF